MKNKSYIINRELSVPEMFSVLSEAEVIIGMRLHSLIYATTLAIPAMALVYDPKINAFMESINQPDCVYVDKFEYKNAKEILNQIIIERGQRKKELRKTNEILKKIAEGNAVYAIDLLNK